MLSNTFCLRSNSPLIPTDSVFADVFFRKLNGGSQSCLIGASDGNFFILKMANNPQGPNTLFNEALGSILAKCIGLPIPDWRPIEVSQLFIKKNPSLRFSIPGGTVAPAPGLHFGSQLIIGPHEGDIYEIVPRGWMRRVENLQHFWGALVLDIWTENVDVRQALFLEESVGRGLTAVFFDHGHMFGGPHGDRKLKNPRACLYSHKSIYTGALGSGITEMFLRSIEALTEDTLWSLIDLIPYQWRTITREQGTIALLLRNQARLRRAVNQVLEELANPASLYPLVMDEQHGKVLRL